MDEAPTAPSYNPFEETNTSGSNPFEEEIEMKKKVVSKSRSPGHKLRKDDSFAKSRTNSSEIDKPAEKIVSKSKSPRHKLRNEDSFVKTRTNSSEIDKPAEKIASKSRSHRHKLRNDDSLAKSRTNLSEVDKPPEKVVSKSRSPAHKLKKEDSSVKSGINLSEINKPAAEDSVLSSIDGTPVMLSREGSRIRVVDDETGEVFFLKRKRSKDYKPGDREPIFVPRRSSVHLVEPVSLYLELDQSADRSQINNNVGILSPQQPSSEVLENVVDLEENLEEDDDAGDVLVITHPKNPNHRSSASNSTVKISPISMSSREKSNSRVSSPPPQGILKRTPIARHKSRTSSSIGGEKLSSSSGKSTTSKSKTSSSFPQTEGKKHSASGSKAPSDADRDQRAADKKRQSSLGLDTSTSEHLGKTKSIRSRSKSPPSKDKLVNKSEKSRDTDSNLNKLERKSSTSRPSSASAATKKNSKSLSKSSRRDDNGVSKIPNEIFEKIFSQYLEANDLEMCSRVCKRWKKLTDPQLRGPLLFKGKSPYGHFYSKKNCRKFVKYLQELESKFYRPYEIILSKACDFQINVLCKTVGREFRSSVLHIQSLEIVNTNCKWKTLIIFLQSFSNLRTLTDSNNDYYTTDGLLTRRQNRQNVEKEMKRQEFLDLKYQLKRIKILKITRKTVDSGLPIFMTIMTQGARNVEELEVTIGPWETVKKSDEKELTGSLNRFIQQLTTFIDKNSKSLKKIKFSWSDKNFIGYFTKCLEVLDKITLDKLTDLSLNFDKNCTKSPGDLLRLRNFLEYHCSKCLRSVTISNLLLGEPWSQTATALDSLMAYHLFCTTFNFHIVLSDCFGLNSAKSTIKMLQLQLFQQFTTEIQFSIESENTKSLAQLIGSQMNCKYPRVKSVLVTFQPMTDTSQTSYESFKSFSMDCLARNYPNLTQLRISDRLIEHQQMFNKVVGKRWKVGVSTAALENKDLQLISAVLVKLKVLKLWVDLSSVDDHGVTGIHRADLSIILESSSEGDGTNAYYTWNNFGHKVEAAFSNLKHLEELSLRGLGQGVTDISAKFGFENLDRLNVLELIGDTKISHQGRRILRRKLKEKNTVLLIKQTIA